MASFATALWDSDQQIVEHGFISYLFKTSLSCQNLSPFSIQKTLFPFDKITSGYFLVLSYCNELL